MTLDAKCFDGIFRFFYTDCIVVVFSFLFICALFKFTISHLIYLQFFLMFLIKTLAASLIVLPSIVSFEIHDLTT